MRTDGKFPNVPRISKEENAHINLLVKTLLKAWHRRERASASVGAMIESHEASHESRSS